MIHFDYMVAKECKNNEVYCVCHKCERCGRKFENGVMVDTGGTTVEEDDDDKEEMSFQDAIKLLATLIKAHPNEVDSRFWKDEMDRQLYDVALDVVADYIKTRRNA